MIDPTENRRLGDFEIIRELGRGGTGVVYEAIQVSLDRRVALKVLAGGLGLAPTAVDCFRREAGAAAKLHHTNIVPVHATGEQDGGHFYALELIEGPSLDRVLKQLLEASRGREPPENLRITQPHESPGAVAPGSPLSSAHIEGPEPAEVAAISASLLSSGTQYFDSVARMISGVADALHFAHQQGVVHRDIKPANLLLSPDGRLSLNNFGLARMLEEPDMTVTGEFVGTPAYLSPEQVTTGRAPPDHRADIYSLGATLYQMLTLRPPFIGELPDQIVGQIIFKQPAPPRTLNKEIPVDLETICLKAMDKNPDRRYQTAGEMAEDLRRYVNRFAIAARRAGLLERTVKWLRRPEIAALLVAAMAAGLFAIRAKWTSDLSMAHDRQAAVDQAIVEAMSGNQLEAVRAIGVAEQIGSEPGQLNMLRGLIEMHRGCADEALVHLDHAEKQWPNSVAVKALLATAYLSDCQFQRYDTMFARVDRMEPKTPEDAIFLAQARSAIDPQRGLQTIDQAPAGARESPVDRLTRAMIQTLYAQTTDRPDDADRALQDFDGIGRPDNPLTLNSQMQALLIAAHAAGPNQTARAGYLKRAADVDARLARFHDAPLAVQGRCNYYYVTGDDDTLLTIVREARGRIDQTAAFDVEWDVHYRRKQFDQALAAIQAIRTTDDTLRSNLAAIVYATTGRTDQAEQLFLANLRRERGGVGATLMAGYFHLLGPSARTDPRKVAHDILDNPSMPIPDLRDGWYRHLLRFHAGEIDAAGLAAKAGTSRLNQCEGFFYIGLCKLYERNRAKAKTWFTRSVETGVFVFGEYIWSRAFLACIDDPNWLPWCK